MITNRNDMLYKIIEVHNPLKNENYYMNRYINPNLVFVRNGRISFGNYVKLQSAPNVSVQRKFCTSVESVYSDLIGKLFEIEILIGNKVYSTIGVFKNVETHYNPTYINSLFNIKEEIIELVFNTMFIRNLRLDVNQLISLREIQSVEHIERDGLMINKQYLIMDANVNHPIKEYHCIGAFWLTDISEDGVCYFRDYHQMYYKNNKNSLSFQTNSNDNRFRYWEIKQNKIER